MQAVDGREGAPEAERADGLGRVLVHLRFKHSIMMLGRSSILIFMLQLKPTILSHLMSSAS